MKFIGSSLALIFFLALQGTAQKAKIAYPSMAPLPQYLIPRDAEISRAGVRRRNQSPEMPKS